MSNANFSASSKLAATERPGYEIMIPGECLKPGSAMWSDAQREYGIWLRMVYLTSSEEEAALGEAQRSGNLASVAMIQVRASLHQLADNVPEEVDVDGSPEHHNVPSAYKPIPRLERRVMWEEFGPQGRALVMAAFSLASSPSEAARSSAMTSFRLAG